MRPTPQKKRRLLVIPMLIMYLLLLLQIPTYAQNNAQYDLNLDTRSASFLIDHALINNLSDPNFGGIRGVLFPNGTWQYPYGFTETTGYIIASLINLYRATANASYLRAAIAASDWEVNAAQYSGSDLEGFGGIRSAFPDDVVLSSWHTATVVNGLAEAWSLTQNQTYLDRIEAGVDFITRANQNQQRLPTAGLIGNYDLKTKYFTSDYLASSAGAQAYFLLSTYKLIENASYLELAEKNLDVLVTSQLANGTWMRYIYNNGTALPYSYHANSPENYAHYIMYIASGMALASQITGREDYLSAATRALNYVALHLRYPNGLIGPGRAEVAQFGLVSKMLYDSTRNSTYLEYANQDVIALISVQRSNGGLLDADYAESTWASKFAIDLALSLLAPAAGLNPHLFLISGKTHSISQSFDGEALTITFDAPQNVPLVLMISSFNRGRPSSVYINGVIATEGEHWTYNNSTNATTVTTAPSGSETAIILSWSSQLAPTIEILLVMSPLIVFSLGTFLLVAIRRTRKP